MLLADVVLGGGWLTAILTGAAAIVGAALNWMNSRHKNRLEKAASAIKEWQDLYETARIELERYRKALQDVQAEVVCLQEEHADCREWQSQMRATFILFRDHMGRQSEAIKRLGGNPDPVPEMLPPELPLHHDDTGFRQRTARQNQELLKGIDKRIVPPDAAKP